MGAIRKSADSDPVGSTKRLSVLAGCTTSSFDQAVYELVENAVGASVTKVAVEICASSLSAKVIDDGKGIGRTDLNVLGIPHCTSSSNQDSLGNKQGLTIFSLASTSTLHIASRAQGEFQTWEKSFRGKAASSVRLATRQQLHSGTSVILSEFMALQPVRRRQLLDEG